MSNSFEAFLSDQIAPGEPTNQIDEDAEFKDYTGYSINNEDESVLRFKSISNSPPSLLSLSIISISALLNQQACDPKNHEQVRAFWAENVKILPKDLKAKIATQCAFTTLKCLRGEGVWNINIEHLLGSIKQEEDMLRFLYWKDSQNPLLRQMEENLILRPLEQKYLDMISDPNTVHVATQSFDASDCLIQPQNDVMKRLAKRHKVEHIEIKYNDEQKAIESFKEWSRNQLAGLDWNNVLVVGGSILNSIRYSTVEKVDLRETFRGTPDIDMYIYGLSPEDAQKKVLEIVKLAMKNKREDVELGIWKSNNTVTIVGLERSRYREFTHVQIILSTYTSPLEVLLSSDFNSCSVAFNGKEIIAIPRFVAGMMYDTNCLDSSIKFGPKLRWERIEKYYKKGFDFLAPLHLRVHGLGPFTTEEEFKRGAVLHPNTVQMVELMCLYKPGIIGELVGNSTNDRYDPTFGFDREGSFRNWHLTWMKGISGHATRRQFPVSGTLTDRNEDGVPFKADYLVLKERLKDIPPWVAQYYKSQQVLLMPHTGIREPPHYLTYMWDQFDVTAGEGHFNPKVNNDLEAYVQEHCKFTPYNESALQCFHLNYLVDKEYSSAVNPYLQTNTSLMELRYSKHYDSWEWKDFTSYLDGTSDTLETSFNLNGRNWKLTLKRASAGISFLILKKEADDESLRSSPGYCPKTFVNFAITCNNTETMYWYLGDRSPYSSHCHYVMDGSQVFTNDEPHNTWMTWITNDYFRPKENVISQYVTDPVFIDEDGETSWRIEMHYIEPKFSTL